MKIDPSITNKRIINGFNKFCIKVKEVHGEYYNYDKVIYKYSTLPVIIVCPVHGDFKQPLSEHCKGRGCYECGKEKMRKSKSTPFEVFKKQASILHENKYTYDKNSYTNLSNTVDINCGIHGKFCQKAEIHLNGSGCPQCAKEIANNKLRFTTTQFIAKAKQIHGDKYDYSKVEYKQNKLSITVTCPIHGDFEQTPHTHLQGSGCVKCRNADLTDTTKSFIAKAIATHGNIYDYSKVVYTKSWHKVTIICPTCGVFQQTASNHLAGKGCNTCKNYGFDQNIPAILYYLSINNGQAYKIGITNRTVKERFGSDTACIKVLQQIKYKLGKDAYNEEQRILKKFKESKYTGPNLLKAGNTELFNIDIFGYDQAHMCTIPNNADLQTIVGKLATLKD